MLKHGITFSLHKRKTDENSDLETYFPVRMRVSFNGQRPDFYTGVSLREVDWNPATQRSWQKKGFENRELDKLEDVISEIFQDFYYQHKKFPTIKELRNAFNIATDKKPAKEDDDILVQNLIDMFSENVGTLNQWTKGTYKKYNKIKNHFTLYDSAVKINQIDESDMIGFIKYFQSGPIDYVTKKNKDPHRNTTIAKNISDFMSVFSWAAKKGIYHGTIHETFNPKFKGSTGGLKDLVFLNWDELMKLYHYDFKSESRARVRDVFCFCCFTGLRYSDVFKLKKSQVKKDHIVVSTEKTIDNLKIEFNDFSAEILEKYKDYESAENKVFPVISLQKYNSILQDIAKELEFDEEINDVFFVGSKRYEIAHKKFDVISSHAARRTFVINGLTLGIPSDVIMKWTGHKNHNAMKPYVKIIDDLKKQEMNKFNKP